EAMDQHQEEKWPERFRPRECQNREPAHEMAEREKALRGEITVGELIAKEHANDRGDRERIQNPRLLACCEPKAWQIAKDQRQPGSPDEEFEHHHQEKLEADCFIHRETNRRKTPRPTQACACS